MYILWILTFRTSQNDTLNCLLKNIILVQVNLPQLLNFILCNLKKQAKFLENSLIRAIGENLYVF